MNAMEEALVTSYILAQERIASLENTLEHLRSQLRDTHAEDGVLITIINNGLNE